MAKAKGVELASAYISLSVSTEDVPRQVERALRGLKDENIEVDVDAKTAGAASNVKRWRSSEERNPVNLKVRADTSHASSQVRGLRRDIEDLGRSDIGRLNLGAAAIHSLPALAAGLAEVAAAMQQVSQAALAMPGAFAGAASSVGTLLFGVSGVADAFEALGKASDDAATSGGDVADQARAQMSASNGLRNAIVDEEQARKDVTRATKDAQRALADLRIEQRGGVIDEKRAVLEAQQAREALLSGDFTDLRDAMLRVEEADQRVVEVRERNRQTTEDLNDANAKGVSGSDQVVAANERLTRAQQNVAEANAAVAASAPAASAAQEAAALAMSKLSPEAQEFAQTLRNLVDGPVKDLRNTLSAKILTGLSDRLNELGTKVAPTAAEGLGGIADAWNNTFNEIADVLGEDESLSLLDRIFGNTADAQNVLNGVIDPLVDGVGTLTAAGSDALPRMSEALVGVSERFADFITEADADGSLARWIDEGLTGLGHLGETVLNIGKMFTGITGAADGNLLANLESWTNKWQAWLNSVEGQNTLKTIFAEGKEVFNEWKPILEDLPGLFAGIYSAADKYMGLLLPILDRVTSILADYPGLIEAAAAAYVVFQGTKVLGAISTLTTSLTGVNTILGTTMPDSASKAGKGLSKGLIGPGSAVILASWGIMELQNKLDELFNTDIFSGQVPGSLMWFLKGGWKNIDFQVPDWLKSPDGPGNTGTTIPQGQGPAANATQGDALDPGFFVPGPGIGSREFAHGSMMPFWQNQGFEVGDHAADQFGEHQNGALDIMVDSIEEGNKVLQQVLKDPNVYGAIFNNQTFGYGNGPGPKPYSAGNTGNPTQDHQDHVHVWYKPGGSNNIAPMPPAAPAHPALPAPPNAPAPNATPRGTDGGSVDDFWRRMLGPQRTFDTGGWVPPGVTPVHNATGKPELILNPQQIEELKRQGIDPQALLHGQAMGAPPGPVGQAVPYAEGAAPTPEQAAALNAGTGRTEGFIPAGAGFSGKTGGGLAGGLIAMGGEAAKGAIQMAADVGKMAASAAATAGTFGAGAAAGPAAGAGIQIGADMAKRGVDYGVEMAGIGIGMLSEQLFPFGAPRWLSDVDATSFIPNMGGGSLATTAAEAIAAGAGPGMADPLTTQHGQAMGAPPGPVPPGMPPAPPNAGMAPTPPPAPPPPPGPANPAPTTPTNDPMTWFKSLGIFDSGGVLQPNSGAINLSKRPEYVFTEQQWKTMESTAARGGGSNVTYNVMGKDLDDALREMKKHERRASGPTMRGKAGLG